MSLKKVLMLSFAAFVAGGSLSAQNLIVGADFATRFDNREYANNDFNESQTLFSARLTPRIGVEWMEKNRLVVGVDLLQDFGNDTRFLTKARPIVYYQSTARTYRPTPVSSTARSCWATIRGRSSATRRRSTTTAFRVSSGIINPPSARIPM